MKFELLLFGTGPLGLGLVAAQAAEAGVSPVLVGRSRGNNPYLFRALSRRRAFAVTFDGEVEAFRCGVADVLPSDTKNGRAAVIEYLVNSPYVVICCAAGAGQSDLASLLEQVVLPRRERDSSGLLVLVPCENNVHPAIKALSDQRSRATKGFLYLDCMVDRICRRLRVGESGLVEVPTERSFEWVVERPDVERIPKRAVTKVSAAMSFLETLGVMQHGNIDEVRLRKRYLMNGLQFSIALFAAANLGDADSSTMGDFTLTPEGFAAAEDLADNYASALELALPDVPAGRIFEWRDWYLGRILNQRTDEVSRIIGQHSAPSVSAFMAARQARLIEPYQFLHEKLGPDASRTAMGQAIELYLESAIRKHRGD